MTIWQVLLLAALAAGIGLLRKGRTLALLFTSAVVFYWLAPPYDNLSYMFWLPTLMLAAAVAGWAFTAPAEERTLRRSLPALACLAGASLLVGLNRYFKIAAFFATITPRPYYILAAWGLVTAGVLLAGLVVRRPRLQRLALVAGVAGTLAAFLMIKSPALFGALYVWMIGLRGGSMAQVPVAIQILGFSYFAFRLLHTIFDRLAGRLPAVRLDEYVVYLLFFPALAAGPIDRVERFVRELRDPQRLTAEGWLTAGRRFFIGMFKKFVLADALALISINAFAPFIHAPFWAWLVLYAFALRLFFDFSGYTDIAIGMGMLAGIRLPENFASPYLKPNLTQFWNAWHMSLTQWFRTYWFNPLVRRLRGGRHAVPAFAVIAIAQLTTMTMIGLWHGMTWNYLLWGLWHAVGLFIHNRWSELTRARAAAWARTPVRKALLQGSGILLTFHYVALGWVFFAFPTPLLAWEFILELVGRG